MCVQSVPFKDEKLLSASNVFCYIWLGVKSRAFSPIYKCCAAIHFVPLSYPRTLIPTCHHKETVQTKKTSWLDNYVNLSFLFSSSLMLFTDQSLSLLYNLTEHLSFLYLNVLFCFFFCFVRCMFKSMFQCSLYNECPFYTLPPFGYSNS